MAKTRNKIDKIALQAVTYLKEYVAVREAILFGSQLTGKAGKFSDIDLAVISPDFKKKTPEELVTILSKISLLCDNAVEIHPYSLQDVKEARHTNFLGQILKLGKVIYKA